MTAHEILLETVRLRGEDPTDTDLLTDYNAVALVGMNEGQRFICERIIKPTYTEDVALDTAKRFDTTDLTYTPRVVQKVAQYEDYTEDANWTVSPSLGFTPVNYNTFVVPAAEAEATVYVTYEVIPTDLVNPYPVAVEGHAAGSTATSPTFIPAQYHRALCYKALAAICTKEDLKDTALFWDAKFHDEVSGISHIDPQTEIESYYTL